MSEVIDLTFSKESIEKHILATLEEVAQLYASEPSDSIKVPDGTAGSFADGWDVQGIVSTAEALECFFIPYFSVKGVREAFWDNRLLPLADIKSALTYLVKGCKDDPNNDGRHSLSGTPYMNFKVVGDSDTESGIERNMDFLDAVCFLLPCLLDAKAISAERQVLISQGILKSAPPDILDDDMIKDIDERILASVKMLRECDLGSGSGWTYTDDPLESDRRDQLYFTWNALEALEVLARYLAISPELVPASARDILGGQGALSTIQLTMREKRSYLSATFLSPDNKNLYLCENKIDFGEEDSNWYYNLFSLLGLLITEYPDKERLTSAFAFLLNNLTGGTLQKARKIDHGRFLLGFGGKLYEKHQKDWSERALSPLMLKVMARLRQLDENILSEVVKVVDEYESSDDVIAASLQQLADERFSSEESGFSNIWSKQGGKALYSIYFTQRSVEALTKLYSTMVPADYVKTYYSTPGLIPGGVPGAVPNLTPRIQIDITGDVINSAIIEKAQEAATQKFRELLDSKDISDLIREKFLSEADSVFKNQWDAFMDYLNNNIESKEPDKQYKKSLDALISVIGKQLIEAVYVLLVSIDPDKAGKIRREDFIARFGKGLLYLIEWETRSKGAIDYGKTLNELQAKSLVQFGDSGTKKKSKE